MQLEWQKERGELTPGVSSAQSTPDASMRHLFVND